MKMELTQKLHKNFDHFAHERDAFEYWLARKPRELSGYTWSRSLQMVVDQAKTACEKAGQTLPKDVAGVGKTIDLSASWWRGPQD